MDFTAPKNIGTLLAFCARSSADAGYYGRLNQLAQHITTWESVSQQAEAHGLGPLLYHHLRAADVVLPSPIQRELRGLFLRHRHANQVRTQVLAEILKAYHSAGIEVLLLKGAALAHMVYPEPGLRPMRDIDILVRKSQADQAQTILAELGFNAPLVDSALPPGHRHLPVAQRNIEGLLVSVEVHHNLFAHGPVDAALDAFLPAAIPLAVGDVTAYTLDYEAMLWHLYQHLKVIFGRIRLIWVADLLSFAEYFSAEIDWSHLRRHYPQLSNCLAFFHFLTPLSETLLNQAAIRPGPPPHDLDLEFRGWPRYSLTGQRDKNWEEIGRDTFFPPEGWLRLYYGFENTPLPRGWHRWGRHPLHILGWAADYILTRGKHVFNPQTPTPGRLSPGAD